MVIFICLHSEMIQVVSICWSVSYSSFCLFSSAVILRHVNVAILQRVKQFVHHLNLSSQFGNGQFSNKVKIFFFYK